MKLYATTSNEKGKKEGIGDNTRIRVELSYGNKILGTVGLYVIRDYPSGEELGYRVVWHSKKTPVLGGQIIEEIEKGKKQKGEKCQLLRGGDVCDKLHCNHELLN